MNPSSVSCLSRVNSADLDVVVTACGTKKAENPSRSLMYACCDREQTQIAEISNFGGKLKTRSNIFFVVRVSSDPQAVTLVDHSPPVDILALRLSDYIGIGITGHERGAFC